MTDLDVAVEASRATWILLEQGDPASLNQVAALREAAGAGAVAAVGLPLSDTIKEVRDGVVRRTIPRETLVDLRGPWLVNRDQLLATIARAQRERWPSSSMLDLCRQAGMPLRVVGGPAS